VEDRSCFGTIELLQDARIIVPGGVDLSRGVSNQYLTRNGITNPDGAQFYIHGIRTRIDVGSDGPADGIHFDEVKVGQLVYYRGSATVKEAMTKDYATSLKTAKLKAKSKANKEKKGEIYRCLRLNLRLGAGMNLDSSHCVLN
jgi:hypothetical protein